MSLISMIAIDPIVTQRAARSVINAISFPGRISPPGTTSVDVALKAFAPTGARVYIAPADADLGIALPSGCTRAPLAEAGFVIALAGELPTLLPCTPRGSLNHPEDGALVFAEVEALSATPLPGMVGLEASGPGVPKVQRFWVQGLPVATVTARAEANSEFPMGIDLILIAKDGAMVGLPRSTQLKLVEA